MDHSTHNKIVSFIWSIADDCLRDVFVRGKYRDVILPMFVLRRLDCLLEPSKDTVLEEVRFQREDADMADLDPHGLREASGYVFYNTSKFTLKSLLGNPSQLEANLKNYLDGFSDNVKEIVDKFDLRNQIRKMAQSDVLHDVIEKFVSEEINLSPDDRKGVGADRKLSHFSGLCRPKTEPGNTVPCWIFVQRGKRSDYHGHGWQDPQAAQSRKEVGARDCAHHGAVA